jgi:hypothetical protein
MYSSSAAPQLLSLIRPGSGTAKKAVSILPFRLIADRCSLKASRLKAER